MRALFLTSMLLIVSPGSTAPKDGANRPEVSAGGRLLSVPNPLVPGQESLRLLQGYLNSVGQVDGDASSMTREQALLLLFALHDYDKSGCLDGLEFMRLLSEVASQQAEGQLVPDAVVLMVDRILESQDLNGDGLLDPTELLLPHEGGQAPAPRSAPSGGDGVVQWAPEEMKGADITEQLGHQGAAEARAEPPAVGAEPPSLSPLGQEGALPQGDSGLEAPGGTEEQGAAGHPGQGANEI